MASFVFPGFVEEGPGFYCETCGGVGTLTIGGVVLLETCPTCHGESRGMTREEFEDLLGQDAAKEEELDRLHEQNPDFFNEIANEMWRGIERRRKK